MASPKAHPQPVTELAEPINTKPVHTTIHPSVPKAPQPTKQTTPIQNKLT